MATKGRGIVQNGILAGGTTDASPATAQTSGRAISETTSEHPHGLVGARMIQWALSQSYEKLPAPVRHAAKRFALDSIGCAFSGWSSHKGKMAAELMLAQGGAEQARVIGRDAKLPPACAAFANAELINGLDFDAIPHTPPLTLPAILALAEARRRSGVDFILALVIAHELAARLSAASSQMQASLLETGVTPDVYGINTESGLATSLALARLLHLDAVRTAHALGLAGYYAPPQVSRNWELLPTKTNVKYVPVGWINQSAVQAALLAESGFTSHPAVLDGPLSFPTFYGWPAWRPERAVAALGEEWKILSVDYKPHAACRFIHSQIDCMARLVAKHKLAPEDIVSITTLGVPFTAHPDPMNVTTQEDGQFSTPYNVALAACGIEINAHAQSDEMRANPLVRSMMRRITWGVHPDSASTKSKDIRSYVARVQVVTKDGRELSEDALYSRGTWNQPDLALSDADLTRKFVANATLIMAPDRAERLADRLWELELVSDMNDLLLA